MKRILALDLGNSSVSIGLFDGYEIVAKERLKTLLSGTVREYRDKLEDLKIFGIKGLEGVIVSSVVPELTETLSTALSVVTGLKPLVLGQDIDSSLSFGVLKPEEVGTDRIANVVGASRLYGEPVIVIDFGTATTISILKDNAFVGGTIMPGLEMMARALNNYTSRLPLVNLNSIDLDKGIEAIGKDTEKNIISGILYGTAGAVERILDEIEFEEACRFRIVLTGGFSVIMARFIKRDFCLDTDLTLKGLRFIYERKDHA